MAPRELLLRPELLLDVIAARILTAAAPLARGNPDRRPPLMTCGPSSATGRPHRHRTARGRPAAAGQPRPRTARQVDDIATARKQVESLGGRWSGERHHYDEGVVMVMHDPEEHQFCIVQYYR